MAERRILSRVVLAEQVTALITERILDREYAPGQRLNIDALSREFDVSSSPIREALTRLSAIGLVSTTSFAGFSVAPVPSRRWFEELRDYRILNEGRAARLLARRPVPDVLARMAATLDAMKGGRFGRKARDYLSFNRTDELFHEALLEGAGNEILAQSVQALRPHLQHARLFADVPRNDGSALEEHRAILAAITAGDEDGADTAMKDHLTASWQRYDRWQAEES